LDIHASCTKTLLEQARKRNVYIGALKKMSWGTWS